MLRNRSRRPTGLFVIAAWLLPQWFAVAEEGPTPVAALERSEPVRFERDVLPVLRQNCLACHNASKAESELSLETAAALLKGGAGGTLVVAGKSAESRLLAIAAGADEPVMPPAGNTVGARRLTSDELGLIKLWIDQGAQADAASGGGTVAWQPLPPGVQPVFSAALSPDGQFAVCSRANQIFVYHVPTLQLVTRLTDPALLSSGMYAQRGVAHLDLVQALAFSPDGYTLASAGYREVKLWRRPRSAAIAQSSTGANHPTAAAISADGNLVAAAGDDRQIRIWRRLDGQVIATLVGHTARVTALRISPDGGQLVSTGADGDLRVWQTSDGAALGHVALPQPATALALLPGPPVQAVVGSAGGPLQVLALPAVSPQLALQSGAAITAAARTADAALTALAREDGRVELRETAGGKLLRIFQGAQGAVRSLAFTPDGARLVGGGDDRRLCVWTVADGALVDSWTVSAAVTALAVSPDGAGVAVGSADGQMGVWRILPPQTAAPPRLESAARVAALGHAGKLLATDGLLDNKPAVVLREAADGRLLRQLAGASSNVMALALSGDDALVAAAALDGGVQVWNAADGALLHNLPGGGVPATAIAFTDTAGQALVGYDNGQLRLVQLSDGAVLRELAGHTRSVAAIRPLPGGECVTIAADQTVRRWRLGDGAASWSAATEALPASLAVSADGQRIAVGTQARTAEIFSAAGQRQTTLTLFDGAVRWLHFTPDGTHLLAAGGVGHVAVAELAAGAVVERLPLPSPPTFMLSGGTINGGPADGMLVGGSDNGLHLVRRRLLRRLANHEAAVRSLGYTPDGAGILSASAAGALRRESLAGGATLTAAYGGALTTMSVSLDGARLAAGGDDGAVKWFDAATLQPAGAVQTKLDAPVTRVAFAPGGAWLAAAGQNGRVLVYDAASGAAWHSYNLHAAAVAHLGATAEAVWTAAADGTLRQAPVVAGQRFIGDAAAVTALEVSPDGALVVAGGADGVVRTLEAASGTLKSKVELGAAVTSQSVRKDGLAAAVTAAGTGRLWKTADGAGVAEFKGDPAAQRELARWSTLTSVAQGKTTAAKEALTAAEKETVARTEAVPKAQEAQVAAAGENQPAAQAAEQAAAALAMADKAATDAAAAQTAATTAQAEAVKSLEATAATAKLATDALETAKKSQAALALAQEALAAAVAASTASLAAKPDDPLLSAAKAAAEAAQTQAAAALTAAQTAATSTEQNLALRNTALQQATEKKTAADQALATVAAAAQAAAEAKAAAEKKSTELAAAAKAAADKLKAAEAAVVDAERGLALARDAQGLAQQKFDSLSALEQQNTTQRDAAGTAAAAVQKPWRSVSFSPDGRTLCVAAEDGRQHRFDAAGGAAIETIAGPAGAVWLASVAADQQLTLHDDGTLHIWHGGQGWELAGRIGPSAADPLDVSQSPLADRVLAVAFSPDGQTLATGGGEPSRSGEVKLWNLADGALKLALPEAHSDTVFGLDFSPDGRYLATASADKFVKVFDAGSGAAVRSFEGHTHHVLSVGWRYDGSVLASSGADKVVKVWSYDTGEQQRTIQGFGKEATSVRFIGATPLTLTSSGDKTLRLHNTDDGKSPRSFGGASEFLYTAAATPDGRLVAAGGQDGVLRIWNGEDGKVLLTLAPPDDSAANQQAAAK